MFIRLLKKISRELSKAQIPYMVIGGQAVLIYGEPRLTKDIDITLGTEIEELEIILNLLNKIELKTLVDNVEDFVRKTMVLPVKDEKSGIRVDLIFSFSPYEKQAIGRANLVHLGKNTIKFASLEDLIIHKVIAGRARDIEDVRSILIKNPSYNYQYISKWLKDFDASQDEQFFISFEKVKREIKQNTFL